VQERVISRKSIDMLLDRGKLHGELNRRETDEKKGTYLGKSGEGDFIERV